MPRLRMSDGWRSRRRISCLSSFATSTGIWDGLSKSNGLLTENLRYLSISKEDSRL